MRFEDEKEIRDAVKAVSHLVNAYGSEEEGLFVKEVGREHRTLQQGFTRLCRRWFLHLARLEECQYDLRNEASVELARKIKMVLWRITPCRLSDSITANWERIQGIQKA